MIYSAFLACLMAVLGCGGDDDNGNYKSTGEITCSPTELTFIANGGEQMVNVKSSGDWLAYTSDGWIKVNPQNSTEKTGVLTVNVDANGTYDDREGTVTVKTGNTRQVINVKQPGIPRPAVDPTMNVPEGYEIDWFDEFTGISLGADWSYEVKNAGWVNNEKQNYVNGNGVTEVSNGTLKINCKKMDGKIYSGRIYAKKNKGWKYGWVEARIKLPKGKGTWPAFWMMPVNESDGWPTCGEIDIMEEVGYHPNYTSSSIHCNSYNHTKGTQKTSERLTPGAEGEFHVYALEWTENYIQTYVDGNPLLHFDNDGAGNKNTWPFNKEFYVILNLAWGGDWGGAQGVDESALPVTMEVDYVRVFKKK